MNNKLRQDADFIILHIPKTAGLSIISAFEAEGKIVGRIHRKPKKMLEKHENLLKNKFVFTFSRNPWDRFVSAFYYSKKMSKIKKSKLRAIIDNCDKVEDLVSLMIHNTEFCNKVLSNLHYKPQVCWVSEHTNFYGRFKKIDEDFIELQKQLGFNKIIELPKFNVSENREEYKEYFKSQKIRDFIGDIYYDDIKFFDYTF